jgi:hypothetical protein
MTSSIRLVFFTCLLTACGSSGGGPPTTGLDKWLPPLPTPDGSPQSVYAGVISEPGQLLGGSARSALVGDTFIRNSRVTFAIQSPARFIGVVPWGGNLVDAQRVDATGAPLGEDHFGEVSLLYVLGRTCAHDRVDVLLDGSGGGPAVVRARGLARANDFLNLKGLGLIPLPADQDPIIDDGVECATTYTLYPDASTLEVAWTLYNGGDVLVEGPMGTVTDVGGETFSYVPGNGFRKDSLESILGSGEPRPFPYAIYQAPGVAYGLVPRSEAGARNAGVTIAGVNVVVFDADTFLDILSQDKFALRLPADSGVTRRADFVVGRHGGDVEAHYRGTTGEATRPLTGQVAWDDGTPAAGARVAFFEDEDGDEVLDDADPIVTYADVGADGQYDLALVPGSYLVRAEVKELARSPAQTLVVGDGAATATFELARPARYDFTVTDAATGDPIPCKVTVVGGTPVGVDPRTDASDRAPNAVRIFHSLYGTSTPLATGDPVDAALELPAGGPYKVLVTRGPEWSMDQVVITPTAGETGTLTFELAHVVDTGGYLATEFHQHAVGSPDSSISYAVRLRTLVAEGVEFFASTDHDFLSDYDPLIDTFGLRGIVDAVVGVEATPFVYGHFIAYPVELTADDPTNGAVDWAAAGDGFALMPGELWQAYRDRGARVVQVNHPRETASHSSFMAYFDVSGLLFDYDGKTFGGTVENQPVPADYLRLPDASAIFSDAFDALEVWNGFDPDDTNGDGWREIQDLDGVLRDYLSFLSFGKVTTPVGNSDSHSKDADVVGMPRTMVRVPDDSRAALLAGVEDDVFSSMTGAARDVVVTDGPMLRVQVNGQDAIGRTIATGASIEVTVEGQVPDWLELDTVEVFINTVLPSLNPYREFTKAITPTLCFSLRPGRQVDDLCDQATMSVAGTPTITLEPAGGGQRRVLRLTFTLPADQLPRPAGAGSDDAWMVVRISGLRAVFPMITGAVSGAVLDTILNGTPAEIDAALRTTGVPAVAFGAATLLDVDGGGWKAPFSP